MEKIGFFLSLACGFGAVWLLDTIIEKKKILLIFPLIFVSALSIFTEASLVALILPYLMYASRKSGKDWILYIGTLLLSILFLLQAFSFDTSMSLWQSISLNPEFLIITVLPFIYLYNGKKGGRSSTFEKYFFYGFYPIHIWILFIIGHLLNH